MDEVRGGGDERAEVVGFLRQFRSMLERVHEVAFDDDAGEPLVARLERHLGVNPRGLSVVSELVGPHREVDADIALCHVAGQDPDMELVGIGGGDARHHMTLGDLIQHMRGIPVGQVDYRQMDTGPRPEDRRRVVASGVWLFRLDGTPVVVRIAGREPRYGREEGNIEVLSPDEATTSAVVDQIRAHMDANSIVRGQVISFGANLYGHGMAGMTFVERPSMSRDDIVLPDGVLERLEGHVVGIGSRREALRKHGQHLKRGVLLYGPPGTGKTHTVRYLLSATPGTTAVLLSGGALSMVSVATRIARAHQPAIVVLEDVDLVAEDRSFDHGPQPLLFEVLDALDGLDADADVAFLLTTNRVRDLERALSQRPGRVDLAAEIALPDVAARLALLRLYGRGLFSEDALSAAAERSEGTTASFAKELVRRAVLAAAVAEVEVGDEHLGEALDGLMSDAEGLTRSLLGVQRSGGSEAEADLSGAFDDAAVPPWAGGDPHPGVYPGAYRDTD